MKTQLLTFSLKATIIVLGLSICLMQNAFGQSKGVLKKQVKSLKEVSQKLKSENELLQMDIDQLKKEKAQLSEENINLRDQLERTRADSAELHQQLEQLKNQVMIKQQEEDGEISDSTQENEEEDIVSHDSYSVDEPCLENDMSLETNASYYINDLRKLGKNGWGVQVYAFSTLCHALKEAKKFKEYYKMYNTYIKVKEVDGQKYYALVYGSLKDKSQAETYCENFKQRARNEDEREAFLVQH